jgi:hypothetical protein
MKLFVTQSPLTNSQQYQYRYCGLNDSRNNTHSEFAEHDEYKLNERLLELDINYLSFLNNEYSRTRQIIGSRFVAEEK